MVVVFNYINAFVATVAVAVTSAAHVDVVEATTIGPEMFRVRHRGVHNPNDQYDRHLFDAVIPTLSQDGVSTELPPLTLELFGTDGTTPLSVDALFQIEYSMADYLENLLQDRWPDSSNNNINIGNDTTSYNAADDDTTAVLPALTRVRTLVTSDIPLYGSSNNNNNNGGNNRRRYHRRHLWESHDDQPDHGGQRSLQLDNNVVIGNELQLIATLTFVDQSPPEESATTETANPTTARQEDGSKTTDGVRQSEIMSLPDETDLQAAAGDAWNDLNFYFGNHLYPSIMVDAPLSVQEEFANLTGIASVIMYPTSAPIDVGTTTSAPSTSPLVTNQPTQLPTTSTAGGDSSNNNNGTIAAINDATNMTQNNNAGVNPLYPALAAGVACFLCTIIVLGYRRQARHSEIIGNKHIDDDGLDKDDPPIHVHDSTFLDDGEEEIEVEDHYIQQTHSNKSRNGNNNNNNRSGSGIVGIQCGQSSRRMKNFDGQDQYDQYGSEDSDYDYDYNNARGVYGDDVDGGVRNAYISSSLFDAQSESSNTNNGDNMNMNMNSERQHPQTNEEEVDVYASLNSDEKKSFLRYINQGYSVQQANQQIISDRQQSQPQSPQSRFFQRQQSRRQQFQERTQSELMSDGQTMVHIPSNLGSSRSIGHDGQIVTNGRGNSFYGRKNQYRPRSMIMTTASSIASSSFDDRDFLRNAQSSGAMNGAPFSGNSISGNSQYSSRQSGNGIPVRGQVAVPPGYDDPNIMILRE